MKKTEYPLIKSFRVWSKSGKEKRYKMGNKPFRSLRILREGNFSKVYFRIDYGMAKTAQGKMEMFYNDYEGTDHKEAVKAFQWFWKYWK